MHYLTTAEVDFAALTPVMRQVVEAKRRHPDALILFRLGDFYELFFEDALEGSKLLDLTLTSRNKNDPRPIPMCGFPYHAMPGHVQRLLEAGRRAAVVEQLEDAAAAKGLVLRGVSHLITPGVVLEPEALDAVRSHHVVALAPGRKGGLGLAVADVSTGSCGLQEVPHPAALAVLLVRLEPREIVLPSSAAAWLDGLAVARGLPQTVREVPEGLPRDAGPTDAALHLLRAYLGEVRPGSLDLLGPPEALDGVAHLTLGRETVLHLELLATARLGRRQGSLLHAVDRTRTAGGGRLLRALLLAPLADRRALEARHHAVAALLADRPARVALREQLGRLCDVARVATRAVAGLVTPRELGALRDSLLVLPELAAELSPLQASVVLAGLTHDVQGGEALAADLQASLCDQPRLLLADGGIIRPGADPRLDELVELTTESHAWLDRFEADEKARTGIATLRVTYNRVTGYGIEIGRSRADQVPAHYHRKQTLKNTERYTTPALVDFERKLQTAEADRIAREGELYRALVGRVAQGAPTLRRIAAALAELDVHAGFAELAAEQHYCQPHLVDAPIVALRGSRHPVVEQTLPAGSFVPNDVHLQGELQGEPARQVAEALLAEGLTPSDDASPAAPEPSQVLLITGPNMAGKSTLMRQVALAAVLAQAGGFVPAEAAVLGVCDTVLTRIGASDDIAEGASTFMVEMRETAALLQAATPRSLVLLDEIGRGTSTWDGLAIAWAVVEALHDRNRALCLFATHYHELVQLAERLPRLRNAHVAVREWGQEIVFVHRLQPGPTSRSHGIAVARLAGLPAPVVERARGLLQRLERFERVRIDAEEAATGQRSRRQLGLFETPPEPVLPAELAGLAAELATVDPDDLSPRAAHALLSCLVARARALPEHLRKGADPETIG